MKSLAHGASNSYLAQVLLRHEVVFRMSTKTLRYVNQLVCVHVTTVTTFLQLLWSEIRNNHMIRNGVQLWMLNLRKTYHPIREKAGRYISDVWDEMNQGILILICFQIILSLWFIIVHSICRKSCIWRFPRVSLVIDCQHISCGCSENLSPSRTAYFICREQ